LGLSGGEVTGGSEGSSDGGADVSGDGSGVSGTGSSEGSGVGSGVSSGGGVRDPAGGEGEALGTEAAVGESATGSEAALLELRRATHTVSSRRRMSRVQNRMCRFILASQ
jgi:hypothetical protein